MKQFGRREFLGAAGAGLGALAAQGGSGAASGGARPNIVFIMSDDHAAPAISAYGRKLIHTPHLDRIAREGMRFDNCFCTNSICSPCRAVVLTGKHSHVNGVLTLNETFDGRQETFPKVLQRAGYHTGMIGKWHLKSEPTGFDAYKVLPGQGKYHDPEFRETGAWDAPETHKGYCTDLITDFALDFLEARPRDKPFLLMYHHKAPHDPFTPKASHRGLFSKPIPEPANLFETHADRPALEMTTQKVGMKHLGYGDRAWDDFQRRLYSAEERAEFDRRTEGLTGKALKREQYQIYLQRYLQCVHSIDENVGRVLDYLELEGLRENTVVVYTSDQGFFLGEHGLFDKRFMYEEALRMPLMVRFPKRIAAGTASDALVSNLDFAQTLLEFAGADAPGAMQGRSFASIAMGAAPEDWREAVYYRYWMHLAHFNIPAHLGVRTKTHKLIYFYGNNKGPDGKTPYARGAGAGATPPYWELYDLRKDPGEARNEFANPEYAAVKAALGRELIRLREAVGDNRDGIDVAAALAGDHSWHG